MGNTLSESLPGHDDLLTKQMAKMAEQVEQYYQSLQRFQHHLIPRYLQNMHQFQANGTQVNLLYQSQQVIRVTCFLIIVSSAGNLQIGNFITIPCTPGMLPLNLGIDGMMLEPGQALTLSQGSAGPIGLMAMGQEMASEGQRW